MYSLWNLGKSVCLGKKLANFFPSSFPDVGEEIRHLARRPRIYTPVCHPVIKPVWHKLYIYTVPKTVSPVYTHNPQTLYIHTDIHSPSFMTMLLATRLATATFRQSLSLFQFNIPVVTLSEMPSENDSVSVLKVRRLGNFYTETTRRIDSAKMTRKLWRHS